MTKEFYEFLTVLKVDYRIDYWIEVRKYLLKGWEGSIAQVEWGIVEYYNELKKNIGNSEAFDIIYHVDIEECAKQCAKFILKSIKE